MSKGRLTALAVEPHAGALEEVLRRFAEKTGVATAFSDARLPRLRDIAPAEEGWVVPLGDLYRRACLGLGIHLGAMASGPQIEAMLGALCERSDANSLFARAARHPGLHRRLRATISELRRWEWTAGDLAEAAIAIPGDAGSKLVELAALWNQLDEVLVELGRTTASAYAVAAMQTGLGAILPFERLFVDATGEENPLACRWLRWLVDNGVEVWVALERTTAAGGLFAVSARTAARLGIELAPAERAAWHEALFTEEQPVGERPKVAIWRVCDTLAECEWVVRAILERIRDGIRPREQVVYCRDPERYGPLLASAAARHGVVVDHRTPVPILSNAFAGVALALLECLAGDDVRALGPVARSSYLPLSHRKAEEMILATREAYRHGSEQWDALETWAKSEPAADWLEDILDWRRRVLGQEATLEVWIERLRAGLIGMLPLPERSAQGEAATAVRDDRAMQAMLRVLVDRATAFDRLRGSPLTLSDFARVCRTAWSQETVVLPAGSHGVRVVSTTAAIGLARVVYAMGMLEGVVPRRRSEDPILFDSEREMLSSVGGSRAPLRTSRDVALEERDEFVRLCAAASEQLLLTHPAADDDRDNIPCFYLERVRALFGDEVEEREIPRESVAPRADDPLATPADQRLAVALERSAEPIEMPRLRTPEARALLHPGDDVEVRIEELADALECPFKTAFRHRLHVVPPVRAAPSVTLAFLPDEVGLIVTADAMEARRALEATLEEHLERLMVDLESWEIELLRSEGRRRIRQWVSREMEAREVWRRDPESVRTRVALGTEGLENELSIGGRKLTFHARVAGTYTQGDRSVLHLVRTKQYRSKVWSATGRRAEQMELGLLFMSQFRKSKRHALDIESPTSERTLLLFDPSDRGTASKRGAGLGVQHLMESDDASPSRFFRATKELVREALARLDRADAAADPGEHCATCHYGELCRVHRDFGETTALPAEEGEA